MNRSPDVELVLRDYFAEDGLTAPDYVLDVVEQRIGRQPRRRAWRLSWRLHPMNRSLTYAAAAAAVLVVAVVGYNLLPRGSSNVGPGASPTVAATSAPTAAATAPAITCAEAGAVCAGPLTAGANSSLNFQPTLTFTVPDGWTNPLDTNRKYTLHYNFTRGHFLQLITQIAIPEQTTDCSRASKPGAGNTVADWVGFLTTHPGLVTTTPTAITIGGYAGMQLDLHVASTWTARCPNSLGPAVVLMVPAAADNKGSSWIDDQQTTMRILDVAGETVIIYMESSSNPADLAALNASFKPIFDTFRFSPAN